MKARIHFEVNGGNDVDSIVLEGTLEELQIQAKDEVEKRNGTNPWSEILEE